MIVSCRDWETKKPRWAKISAFGPYFLRKDEREQDYHYHDCDEHIVVTGGKATLRLEGKARKLQKGVIVAIPKGARHQITKVNEDLTVLWMYGLLSGRKRAGHITEDILGCPCARDLPIVVTDWGRWPKEKPAWSLITAVGFLEYPKKGWIDMDYHYHDCHEYYFVMGGKIQVLLDGCRHTAKRGDVVCIKRGTLHTVLGAREEDSSLIWLMGPLTGKRRYGHLHLKWNLAISKPPAQ